MHKYIADKRIIFGTAGVLVVGIVLAVVLSGRNRPTPSAEASPAIVLKLPDNSPLAKHNPRATVIENPAMLPQAPDGVKLLAAGRFEPSGLQFPDGITVTRPLLESRPVGARLTIAVLDESTSRWIDTGERAVVADSGRAATGIVYHFSVLGAVRGTIEAKGEPTTDPPDVKKKDDDPSKKLPLSIITWKFTKLDTEKVVDARGLDLKKGAEELNKALSGVTDVAADNVKKTQDVFRKYSFEEVEKIAKAHLLDKPVSDILARHRRELINKALSEAMNAVDPGRQFTLGALDSGNKKSGIASDVDQTLFLIPRDPKDGKGVNFSELNNRLITAFNEKFQAANGYPPARLGIESMNGADFFPDWKQEQSVADFKAEADRVYVEKRKNSEAYRSEGELKAQAEGRGYEALQAQTRKVNALVEKQEELSRLQNEPAENRKLLGELLQMKEFAQYKGGDYKLETLADLERVLAIESPWTEVSWGDAKSGPRVSMIEAPGKKVLPDKPEFSKRMGFDGTWDNWVMYEHHPHNRPKYLLRDLVDGAGVEHGSRSGLTLVPFD